MGRQTLRVRICSCPKRDKEKEEKEHNDNTPIPRGKKRKLEKSEKKVSGCDVDNKEYKLTVIFIKFNIYQIINLLYFLVELSWQT